MNILIVVATKLELRGLKQFPSENIDILITGIGTALTIFKLMQQLENKKYDLILNIGIAGSFSDKLKLGDIVIVEAEIFGDLGFEEENSFIPIDNSELGQLQRNSFMNSFNLPVISDLPRVRSITVNTSTGKNASVNMRKSLFNADIENMEGAGVFLVCSEKNIPFLEIRAISNRIESRNTKHWNIPLAVDKLSERTNLLINNLLDND